MTNFPLALAAALTLAGAVALVVTVVVIVPRIFRDHYRHEIWRITADLNRDARAGEVPRHEARELTRTIDRHAELVTRLSGSDVLAYRITRRLLGAPSSDDGCQAIHQWESQPALAPYIRRMDEAAAKALMYSTFSGWIFTLYWAVKAKASWRSGGRHSHHSRYGAAEAGARRAVRRLEDFAEAARA